MSAAAQVLRSGGLVAFPTETVYGLGAVATDPVAVGRIFEAKGRPPEDPLIVHVVADWPLDALVAGVPAVAARLIDQFWPGPLTLVLDRGPEVPDVVTGGLATVAVRAPAHPVAEALLTATGAPLAAPSANRFGHVSPTSAAHVLDDLRDRIDIVLDAGDSTFGLESTVVAVVGDAVEVLRHGALPAEHLGVPVIDGPASDPRPRSPGRLTRHYSPTTEMRVVEVGDRVVLPSLGSAVYLGYDDTVRHLPDGWRFVPLGTRDALGAVAARLYRVMRSVDASGPEMIVAELTGRPGLGRAIDDRLHRAAAGRRLR